VLCDGAGGRHSGGDGHRSTNHDIRQLDVAQLRAQLSLDSMELAPRRHTAFAPELTPDPAAAL
jgi:hypothetical protein